MAENYIRVVVITAKKLAGNNVSLFRELESEGYVHLARAIRTWNPDDKIKFNTYAAVVIRNGCIDFIRRSQKWDDEELDANFQEDLQDDSFNPEELTVLREEYELDMAYIDDIAKRLKPIQRTILYERLVATKPITQEEVAEEYKVNQSTVVRQERKLKEMLKSIYEGVN
jgi:RNA polymerase sigma factor (sigma-70 family)